MTLITGDEDAGRPAVRFVRVPGLVTKNGNESRSKARGYSVYRVEVLKQAPTFNKGDGYDGGRNLISHLLIGPHWSTVAYVIGRKGEWRGTISMRTRGRMSVWHRDNLSTETSLSVREAVVLLIGRILETS